MNALQKAMAELNKKHKAELITVGTSMIYHEKIPFGNPYLNYMTYGGIPVGKATELIGAEGGGKTTTAIDLTASAQRLAQQQYEDEMMQLHDRLTEERVKSSVAALKKCKEIEAQIDVLTERGARQVVYVDAENTFNEEWAALNGVDLDSLIMFRPQQETAEEVLQAMLNLIDTGLVYLMVLDSLPMLVSQKVFDENLDKKTYGGIADAVTEFCKKATPKLTKGKTALVIINQVREDFDNPYNQMNTPGGKALKHFYSLRLFFKKDKYIDADYNELTNKGAVEPFGHKVDVQLVKTKVCKPNRRIGQYTINYTDGIDHFYDTINMAIKYDLIRKSGSWYAVMNDDDTIRLDENEDEIRTQGLASMIDKLKEDEDLFGEISEEVLRRVSAA